MTRYYRLLLFILIAQVVTAQSLVNTNHLDYLFQKMPVGKSEIGIIHIYAEAPDYHYIEASREGVSCVDDVARGAVLYAMRYREKPDPATLEKIVLLSRYQLYTQNANGYFNNFVFADGSVNTTFQTSVAEANWWSWRAVWALASVYDIIAAKEPALGDSIRTALKATVNTIRPLYVMKKEHAVYDGICVPMWLPAECGADQAAVLVKGLVKYYAIDRDTSVFPIIRSLCDGIIKMQITDKSCEYYGAFLSWRNNWHAWGNSQSDALLDAYNILKDPSYLEAAQKEIDSFYGKIQNKNYLMSFALKGQDSTVVVMNEEQFEQIAYNIRPMIFSCMNAYGITKDTRYARKAVELAGWFFGKNVANCKVYSPETGRCFDGINNPEKANLNSGAESTIEALLSLAMIESSPETKALLFEKYLAK